MKSLPAHKTGASTKEALTLILPTLTLLLLLLPHTELLLLQKTNPFSFREIPQGKRDLGKRVTGDDDDEGLL